MTAVTSDVAESALLRQRAGFDRLASIYDFLLFLAFGPFMTRFQRAGTEVLPPRRRALVLGCGTGAFLVDLLRTGVDEVVALDISPGMLQQAERRLARDLPASTDRVTFQCGTVADLHGTGSFDLICTHCFLDCFSDVTLAQLMATLDRRLCPDGLWLCFDFQVSERSRLHRLVSQSLIAALYRFFHMVCRIDARRLPAIPEAFSTLGYETVSERHFGHGLFAELLYRKPRIAQ